MSSNRVVETRDTRMGKIEIAAENDAHRDPEGTVVDERDNERDVKQCQNRYNGGCGPTSHDRRTSG